MQTMRARTLVRARLFFFQRPWLAKILALVGFGAAVGAGISRIAGPLRDLCRHSLLHQQAEMIPVPSRLAATHSGLILLF